jgi:acetyl esterase/lipase
VRIHFYCLIAAGLVALCVVPDVSAQKLPDGVEIVRDVEYGKGDDRPLRMHILHPKTLPKESMPVVVWMHGGAWTTGHRDGGINRLVPFAQRGYLCATIEYRFSQEAIFPAQIEDAKCAIRYLRTKAIDYHLDPDRIGVWGYSAGGHLAVLLGTSGQVKKLEGKGGWPDASSRVQAVCSFAGPTDFLKWGNDAHPAVVKLLGGKVNDVKERAAEASAITFVGKDMPPFLIVHGEKDTTVPVSQAESLHDALKKANADVKLHVIKGGGHVFGSAEIDRMVVEFFDTKLKAGAAKKATPDK